MADDPAERALSDSQSAGGGAGKALARQQDGELSTAIEAAQDFMAASRSKATLRAYRSDWHDFEKWCDRHCLITMPADARTVAAYLSSMATGRPMKLATIRRRLATIDYAHRALKSSGVS
jgi:site-specific recombinase XerD